MELLPNMTGKIKLAYANEDEKRTFRDGLGQLLCAEHHSKQATVERLLQI